MSLLTAAKPRATREDFAESYVPPLENGDRLTRAEFEHRYNAMPPHVRAELIEGVVAMASPVRFEAHSEQHAEILHFVMLYRDGTPGVRVGDNATVRLDLANEPQPDVCLLIDPARGGAAKIDKDGYIEGAPELVAEVAASTASQDLGPKLNAYQRNGVKEYVVWRVQDAAIDWFILRNGRFDQLQPDSDGITRSEVFPGLWLDTSALLKGDLPRVHAVLRDGIAAPAHAAFIAKIAG